MPPQAPNTVTRDTGYFIGLDLGQAADYTAIAVARRLEVRTLATRADDEREAEAAYREGRSRRFRFGEVMKGPEVHFAVRHLERLPLGTPYPQVVRRTREVLEHRELWVATGSGSRYVARRGGVVPLAAEPVLVKPTLVVDATGAGRPVVDMLQAEGLDPVPVTITGGDQATYERGWRVPKRDLVGALQVLLQTGRLEVAESLPLAPTLVSELLTFRVRIDPLTAHDGYGAWREGQHDDLVLALAVAAWYGLKLPPQHYGEYPVFQR